jgi:asparagine synthase (glutamine-hydrolysing)
MDTDELLRLLRISTEECVASSNSVAVAYSGGVDSAVVERIAREFAKAVCYTCAVRGSHDYARAPLAAEEGGAELRMVVLDRDGLAGLVSKARSVLDTEDLLRIAYSVPILCVIDASEQEGVLVGSGADELFGGYAKYLNKDDPETAMASDIKKMQAENELLKKYAKSVGKRLEAPFISRDLISFAKGLATDRKLKHGERKVILREAAKALGVLSHDAPKKAAQYSSGVMKEMKRMAKEQGMELREWTAERAAKGRRIP